MSEDIPRQVTEINMERCFPVIVNFLPEYLDLQKCSKTEYSKSMIIENRIICIVTGKILIMLFVALKYSQLTSF
jgi:hypothetical protein